ncbi:PAS domain S-box protein [Mesorhizobium silamurunense]|uniref:PAS domain S-box protein n=1 Tax=Mesorhizobium silamurunense TaxID=499528 RepID=UPI001784F2BB|nr:PAS domain S-box protein [Mesorhizobium silamurunense]
MKSKFAGLQSASPGYDSGLQSKFDFQDFFENGTLALHVIAADGTVLYANKAALELLGYPAEDYIGRHVAEFYANRAESDEILEQLRRGATVNRCPVKMRTRDGGIKNVELTSNGKYENGKLLYIRCFTVNVTELKKSRDEITRDEDPFRQILESLPVAIYTTDPGGKITYYNKAAAQLAGREPQVGSDEGGVTLRLFTTEGNELPHADYPMVMALKENGLIRNVEGVAQRPDGTFVPFLTLPTPLRDAEGNLTGSVNMLFDLSEHKRNERARQRLSAIVESSFDAIISKDLDGFIQSWNVAAERLFGYSADEAVGKHITMLIPPEHRDEEDYIIARIRAGGRVDSFETVRRRKDGSLINVSLVISPIRDDTGRIIGASKIARDITPAKESEHRIKLLMREVNHRVKNQFAVITSMVRETAKWANDPREFERNIRDRIAALARSHDLLVISDWSGATLFDLIQEHLKPFGHEDQISLSGPVLTLQPNAVQYIGIALHELATNSAKYGALSNGLGQVSVTWRVNPKISGQKEFELNWEEKYVPAMSTNYDSERKGFGTIVLERVTAQAIGGAAVLKREPGFVGWVLTAPSTSLAVAQVTELHDVDLEPAL